MADAVGDLLLCWHADPAVHSRRPRAQRVPGTEAAWHPLAHGADWTLWHLPLSAAMRAGPGWQGYDLWHGGTARWEVWLLTDWVPREVREAFDPTMQHGGAGDDDDDDAEPCVPDNGQFLLLARHRGHGGWFAATDRFGSLHAYAAVLDGEHNGGGGVVVGTYQAAVARHAGAKEQAGELDPVGLASFACCGFYLGDRTADAHVRALRPATRYSLDVASPFGLRELGRTAPWRYEPAWRRDVPDTVAELDAVLQRTMADQLAGVPAERAALPLSGGLDSRMLLAAVTRSQDDPLAVAAGPSVWAYSYDYAGMRLETRIARQLAVRRQIPFAAYEVVPYLFALLPRLGPVLDGAQDVTQCRQAAVLTALRERADVVIGGHWGDVWFDDAGLNGNGAFNGNDNGSGHTPDDDAALAGVMIRKALKPGHEWLMHHFVRPLLASTLGGDAAKQPLAVLEAAMRNEVARVPGLDDVDARAKAVKTETWSFRFTLPSLRSTRMATRLRLPFYDSRFADWVATVPSRLMRGRALQIAYLQQIAPDLACVRWQAADAPLWRHPRPRWERLVRSAARHGWRRITGQPLVQRNWEVQFLPTLGRERLRNTLLAGDARLHEWVPRPAMQRLLDELEQQPTRERGYVAAILLTLHEWLQRRG